MNRTFATIATTVVMLGPVLAGAQQSKVNVQDPGIYPDSMIVDIPDKMLRRYCVEGVEIAGHIYGGFDRNGDGLIQYAEIKEIKKIDLHNAGIFSHIQTDDYDSKSVGHVRNLKGIEYFTALEYLDVRSNRLTSIDVSKNGRLRHLNCSQNGLQALDVTTNTALEILDCSGGSPGYSSEEGVLYNDIKSIDLSKNAVLAGFYCSNAGLKSLDVTKNPNLRSLDCSFNALQRLDISKNTSLVELNCVNCLLDVLDVVANTNLTELSCGENLLSGIDLSRNKKLRKFIFHYSGDIYLGNDSDGYPIRISLPRLDLSGNPNIEEVVCPATGIGLLNVTGCRKLMHLNCRDNELTSLDLRTNKELKELICSSNQISSINLSGNVKLTDLDCDAGEIIYPSTWVNIGGEWRPGF